VGSRKIGPAAGARLGEMLVAQEFITHEQLAKALDEQKDGEDLGSTLLRLRFILEEQLVGFLSRQYGIPSIVLSEVHLDREVLDLIPLSTAVEYDVLPISRHGTTLTVAMADPADVFAVDTVAFLTQMQVTRVVASRHAIREVLERCYDTHANAVEAPPGDAAPADLGDGRGATHEPGDAAALVEPVSPPPVRPVHRINQRLGDLLIGEGLIDAGQLAKALKTQQGTGEKLGSILVRLSFLREDELIGFLSRQFGIPSITLSQLDLDPDVLRLIPVGVAKKYDVLPISRQGATLTLAMADPTNLAAIDEIAFITNLQIAPVVASESAIRTAIERNYEANAGTIAALLADFANDATHLEIVDEGQHARVDAVELEGAAGEAPVVRLVNMVLADAIRKGASDIHWEPYENIFRIRFRIDGVLHETLAPPKQHEAAILSRIKIMSSLDISERRLPQDGRIKVRHNGREIDFRVSVLPTIFGEKAVLRILDKDALKLDLTQLGFDPWSLEKFTHAIHQPNGMVLITGPTGSGKTTTLYSAIHTINTPQHNIMTVEDPVEYNLKGVNQVQVDGGIGRSFASALRSFLRQDPDVILVGETRDLETAQISIRAALTGHLVFSTLHTNDCASTIARLVDMGIPRFLISSALILLVAQRLARKICAGCRQPYEADEESLVPYGHVPVGVGTTELYKGNGCAACSFTGMRGRVAIYEVMPISAELRDGILHAATTAELRQLAQSQGMKTLRQSGLQKVVEGTTTVDEILRVTMS
jgi:type IV pilus assembly protein PilB